MAAKTFHLEIVTPQGMLFDADVQSFSAPGFMGAFQVLANHAPLLASLTVGEVKLSGVDGRNTRFSTSGGFVEVLGNKVVMVAETAERADEIDVARAQMAADREKERLAGRPGEAERELARAALQRALNRLKVAGRAR